MSPSHGLGCNCGPPGRTPTARACPASRASARPLSPSRAWWGCLLLRSHISGSRPQNLTGSLMTDDGEELLCLITSTGVHKRCRVSVNNAYSLFTWVALKIRYAFMVTFSTLSIKHCPLYPPRAPHNLPPRSPENHTHHARSRCPSSRSHPARPGPWARAAGL